MIDEKGTLQHYYYYKKHYRSHVTREEYRAISGGFNKFIIETIFSGKDVKLGGGDSLGQLGVRGKKIIPKTSPVTGEIINLAPDWLRTKQLWNTDPVAKAEGRKIYFFNEHTNGIRYHVVWIVNHAVLANKSVYDFRLAKTMRDDIHNLIMEGVEYQVIPAKVKMK